MTRDQILAVYRPIRSEIRRHLTAAPKFAEQADWLRIAETLDIVAGSSVLIEGGAGSNPNGFFGGFFRFAITTFTLDAITGPLTET